MNHKKAFQKVGNIAEKTIKVLFALSGNRCAFPNCTTPVMDGRTVAAEICHIHAASVGGPRFSAFLSDQERNASTNLMLMCANHHKLVDDQPDVYTAEFLRFIKTTHEERFGRAAQSDDDVAASLINQASRSVTVIKPTGHVAVNSPGAIQANVVNLHGRSPRITVTAPPGTLGANKNLASYIEYLIKRYSEFARADKTREKAFNHGAIYNNLAKKFGAQWKFIDELRFDELCRYLQTRIERTIRSKQNNAKGWKSYSSYDEFISKTSK